MTDHTNDNDTPRLKKLKQQQEKLRKQMILEKKRISAQNRKNDTRRKILTGATLLEAAKKDTQLKGTIDTLLHSNLTRNDDRALFGLPPLQTDTNDKTAQEK